MNTYSVKPGTFNEIQKRVLLCLVLFSSIVLLGALYALPSNRFNICAFLIAMAIVLVAFGLAFQHSLRKLRETWPTYSLTIGEDFILRKQLHYADVKIERDEITTILKTITGDILVKNKNFLKFIVIPSRLDGLEDVERLLNQWKPIKQVSKKKTVCMLFIGVLILFGILAGLEYLVSATGFGLVTINILSFFAACLMTILLLLMWRLPHSDDRAKPKRRRSILIIGYLLLIVIGAIVYVLSETSIISKQ